MEPVVRPMGEADAGQVEELETMARALVSDQRGGAAWLAENLPGEWKVTDRDPEVTRGVVWVATVDAVAVGFLEFVWKGDRRGRLGVVRQVFVHPQAREIGCGDALLAAALDHARANGAVALEATALPGDRNTKNLYERAGITARKIVVSRSLVSDPSMPGDASR